MPEYSQVNNQLMKMIRQNRRQARRLLMAQLELGNKGGRMDEQLNVAQVIRKLRDLGLCADQDTVREIFYQEKKLEGGE